MALLSLTHPGWVAIGIVLIAAGIWLIRWANRNAMTGQIKAAAAEAASQALRRGSHDQLPSASGSADEDTANTRSSKGNRVAAYGVRHAMSQLFGVIGFIAAVVGLILVVLGAFYS